MVPLSCKLFLHTYYYNELILYVHLILTDGLHVIAMVCFNKTILAKFYYHSATCIAINLLTSGEWLCAWPKLVSYIRSYIDPVL